MKHLSRRWLWAGLVCSLAIVVGSLLLTGRSRVESAAGTGVVQVGFSTTLIPAEGQPTSIAQDYQRVLLNVVSVRLNPTAGATDSDSGWVEIPAPAAIGSTNPTQFITTSSNFGGSGTLLTAANSILQLDLVPLQNLPFFFNAGSIASNIYQQVEVVLDSLTPGNAVPLCHSGPSEGCIAYPEATTPQSVLSAQFSNGGYELIPNTVQSLLVNITMNVGPAPTGNPPSGVPITPVISAQGNLQPPFTLPSGIGLVTGTVTNFDPSTTIVTAEFSGTNQIVAATHLFGDGSFTLNLPALSNEQGGTLYDFYVSGNGGYVVNSGVVVVSGTNSPLDFTVPSSTLGSISGTIADVCNGSPIQAATLKLLVPEVQPGSAPQSCDLTGQPPATPPNCVVVASAATDDQGHYPLPSAPFTKVPVFPPSGVLHYDLEISAAGYNTTVVPIAPGSLFCPASRFPNSCSFSLEHGYLTGATDVSSPNGTGNRLDALVMAEDSGTNNIENVTLSTIPGGASSGAFTISVPVAAPSSDAIPVSNFDVFASLQDLFGGSPQKNSGHLIGTAASVGAPSADCSTIPIPALSPMDCGGLGSVYGSVTNANPGTTSVRLSKASVQIMETEPNSIGAPPDANVFNFCAPSDSYTLTHYESGTAKSPPVPVILEPPLTISAPCASICNQGSTCLVCRPTTLATPLP